MGLYENDIATLLHYYKPDMAILLDKLAAYVNESDLAKIRGIIADIQNRIQRFRNDSE